jgi:arylsulfatase
MTANPSLRISVFRQCTRPSPHRTTGWINTRAFYDKGYDAIRAERLARLKELGIVSKDAPLAPRVASIPAWEKLTPEQQKLSARRMEIYAAMLANMDFHIGRVLDHLKSNGQLDDTLVVFMSDNGAEPTELAKLVELVFDEKAKKWFLANFDTRPENWGRKGSTVDYGPAWAQVGSTPFRFYKAWTAEGGIHSPVIIAGPGVKEDVIVEDGNHTRRIYCLPPQIATCYSRSVNRSIFYIIGVIVVIVIVLKLLHVF